MLLVSAARSLPGDSPGAGSRRADHRAVHEDVESLLGIDGDPRAVYVSVATEPSSKLIVAMKLSVLE